MCNKTLDVTTTVGDLGNLIRVITLPGTATLGVLVAFTPGVCAVNAVSGGIEMAPITSGRQ